MLILLQHEGHCHCILQFDFVHRIRGGCCVNLGWRARHHHPQIGRNGMDVGSEYAQSNILATPPVNTFTFPATNQSLYFRLRL